jgi:hypothetical protein
MRSTILNAYHTARSARTGRRPGSPTGDNPVGPEGSYPENQCAGAGLVLW